MTLRDILKKKDKIEEENSSDASPVLTDPHFTILRSDSNTQEVLDLPAASDGASDEKRRFHLRRRAGSTPGSKSPGHDRRLSSMFHRRGSHASRSQSPSLPDELENIEDTGTSPEEKEAKWEKRATMLATGTATLELPEGANRSGHARRISDAKSDDDVAMAISLHEGGALEQSTAMFGRLADPQGENNALSQVLYGLALRHGWGIPSNPERAVIYLSLAARNSAEVETQALQAGMKKGGAAKGELVLAIFELANCYADGLGVAKDPVAARKYYETAAQLGDIDALEQAARCYEQGIGGKKDKFMAAKYYRLAEEKGQKIVGNSWIWKEKYDPKPQGEE